MGIIQCNLLQISKLRKTVKKYDTTPLPLQTYISTPVEMLQKIKLT